MEEAADIVQKRGLSVRQTEDLVRKLQVPPTSPAQTPADSEMQAQIEYLENQFRSSLGTRVNLSRNPDGSGRLIVHFYGDDDLQSLYQRMVGDDGA